MNIAFYIPVLNVGGAEKVIVNLLKQLSLRQDDKYFLITDVKNSSWINQIDEKIIILNVNSDTNIFKRIVCIRNVLKSNKIKLVVSHLTHSNIHCLLVKMFYKSKLIIVEHSITSYYINTLRFFDFLIKYFLIKYLYDYADSIICVSETSKDDLINKFNISSVNCDVIYNPLDFENITLLSKESLPIKSEKFIASRKFIVTIGRLEILKNHIFLIQSLKKYLIEKNLVLIIVGDGSEKSKLEKKIYEDSLGKNVLLIGFDSNPYKYIAKSELLIHPSKFEGFGLVLIEALFLSKPVISFNFQAAYEILEFGKLGHLINDKETLINALNLELDSLNGGVKIDFSKQIYNSYNLEVISNQYHNCFLSLS